MDMINLSVNELAKLIREKKVSAVEATQAALKQIERLDGRPGSVEPYIPQSQDEEKVHAFITVTAEHALEKAAAVDKRIAAGESVGPLAGVPYSAKDVYCTKGIQTTAASKILSNWRPPYDATVIQRLNNADAVLIGKVNCDEFTFGSSNETTAFLPASRNPWDLSRVPGGSSGGSAAAVASCEGTFSIGTDTGGSIREPAAFCGIVGIKPTYGRVSRYGTIPFASSMDTMGPMTKTVADAALVLREMAGFDPHDNVTVHVPVDDYVKELEKGVKGMRIGISPDYMRVTYMGKEKSYDTEPIDPEIQRITENAIEILRSLGAEIIEDVPMSNTKYSVPAYFVISRIEAYSNLQRYDGLKYGYSTSRTPKDMYDLYYKSRGEAFGYQAKLRLMTGVWASQDKFYEKYYRRAQRARAMMRRDYDQAFDPNGKYRLDAMLTPSTPTPAFELGGETSGNPILMQFADQFTAPMNFSGTPGISFPAGISQSGLPIGLQAAGYDYCESKILRVAYAFEQATKDAEWRKARPAILG